MDIGQSFALTIGANIRNNGPAFTAQGNVTWNLTVPTGCVRQPGATQATGNITLPQGASVGLSSPPWTVTCNVGGQLQFAARATVSPTDPSVSDPTSFNDFRTAMAQVFVVDPNAAVVLEASADIDCDGAPTSTDALAIMKHAAGLGPLPQDGCVTAAHMMTASADAARTPGDLTCDGNVNVLDALGILRWIAGFEVQSSVRNCFGFA